MRCGKPGAGLLDAPHFFSMKLGMATRDERGLIPSNIDPESCRWDDGELTCITTMHVDGLKVSGKPEVVNHVFAEI